MKLCRQCERGHKEIKSTRSHKLIEIEEKVRIEALHQSMPPSYCDQHKDKSIEIYCLDCKTRICIECWRCSIVVRTLVSAGELSLSCARLLAG